MQPGARLCHYRILSAIGKGGMGEVWKAQDTTLRREVAIKTLPEEFAKHPDRLARFEREATLLASLNHPNIAAIHGLEEHQGTRFLVLELVEGRMLTPPAGRGPDAVEEALRIALQIAEALEFAHEKGVIHRDLKPANIKVTPEGRIKVLDFGLAKALAPAAEETLTITALATDVGVIMGTPAYMSPEQARGDVTGPQADIWSFGVVLYELLIGTSPFERRSTAETLASVLGPPPDFTVLPAALPASAHVLVRRCLEKDRKRRFQHMGDVRIALEEALASLATESAPTSGSPAAGWRRRRVSQAAGAIALSALTGAVGWSVAPRTVESPTGVMRLSIPALEAPRVFPSGVRHLAVSADGSRMAYASAGGLLIRQMGQNDAVVIDVAASDPFFSPTGEWVGFFGAGGEAGLKKVSVLGGAPVLVAATPERSGGGTWGQDGTIVFATTEGLYQVAESGGSPRLLAKPDPARKERAYAWPQFVPGGRSVIFTIVPEGSIDRAQIALLNLDTLAATELLTGGSAASYTSTGHLVYGSGSMLKAVAFDLATQRTRGDPAELPDIQIASTLDNGAAEFALSQTGTLLFLAPGAPDQTLMTLSWIDRQGKEEPLPLGPGRYSYARVSPDGSRVAIDIHSGANRDIWIWNLQRKSLTSLTAGPTEDILPAWSPNSDRIYFSSNRTGTFDVYSQAADGASKERVEFAAAGTQMVSAFTPNGGQLLLVENFKDLSVLTLAQPNRLEPLLRSEFDEWIPVVSPDGHWMAYESNESGNQVEIFVRPFPNVGDRREKISIDGGRYPLWVAGGLHYVDLDGNMMAASVKTAPTLSMGKVTKLFTTAKPSRGISGRPYDVSPIDGRFLMTKPAGGPDALVNISVVLNWFQELRERVPIPAR